MRRDQPTARTHGSYRAPGRILKTTRMSFDPASLAASLFVSSVGYVFFSYGRKQRRMPQIVVGVLMLVYPYFVTDVALMMIVMAVLCVLCWVALRLGL
jgi:hypothetical protein